MKMIKVQIQRLPEKQSENIMEQASPFSLNVIAAT